MKMISRITLVLFIFIFSTSVVHAQITNLFAPSLIPEVFLTFSPNIGSFERDSIIDVPIFVDTNGHSINAVEIKIDFDPDKLLFLGPSGDKSIIGIWTEPPKYDNKKGEVIYTGIVPNGIITSSGLLATMKFKAIGIGEASIFFDDDTEILLNDGFGTKTKVRIDRANYSILPKAPLGPKVYSETHPFQGKWYKNSNPIISWDKEKNVEGYSYDLDHKPGTIPDNNVDTAETLIQFEDLKDGPWYFHIKSKRNGIWGQTGTYLLKIDTTPPAKFKPKVNHLLAAVTTFEKILVSFFTTDKLSGVSHYEIGVLDKDDENTASPVFVQSESPYQLSLEKGNKMHVIVRAFDEAGNIQESGIDVSPPGKLLDYFKKNIGPVGVMIIIILIVGLLGYYLGGHKCVKAIKTRVTRKKRRKKR
jgi:hypothetical protein